MTKRVTVCLEDVASHDTLCKAFHLAVRGKRRRLEVQRFEASFDQELAAMRREILAETISVGKMRVFRIRDPKPRTIHAPCFRERVLHHALMLHIGPILERSLIDDSYACRVGKGTLAAVKRAQCLSQRHDHFAKIDIRSYFASIDHEILLSLLHRRIKGAGVLRLIDRILDAHHAAPGKGLPIRALTSQHFANFYLGSLDRLLLEKHRLGSDPAVVQCVSDLRDAEHLLGRRCVGRACGFRREGSPTTGSLRSQFRVLPLVVCERC